MGSFDNLSTGMSFRNVGGEIHYYPSGPMKTGYRVSREEKATIESAIRDYYQRCGAIFAAWFFLSILTSKQVGITLTAIFLVTVTILHYRKLAEIKAKLEKIEPDSGRDFDDERSPELRAKVIAIIAIFTGMAYLAFLLELSENRFMAGLFGLLSAYLGFCLALAIWRYFAQRR